jgi:transmembrane sensor
MNFRRPLPPPRNPPARVMRAAGAWLARRDRGLTTTEEVEFSAWLQADPVHTAAMAQLERTFEKFDRLRELAPHEAAEPDADVFARRRTRPGVRRGILRSAAVAGLAAAAALAFMFVRPQAPTAPASWQYATAAAGYERALLIDGSTIDLNGDTAVDVEFTASERRVRLLRGEAHFQVAKNASRPFIVSAGSVAVRVVGTAFNIRLDPAAVEVLVTEGKVSVEPPAPAAPSSRAAASPPAGASTAGPLLTAGHKLVVPTANAVAPSVAAVTPDEIERALAWQPKVAEFRKTPLADVISEFNRYSAGRQAPRLVIDDPALEALRIGGSFRADQPEAFVRLLEAGFGISAQRSGDTITLRRAP